MAFASLLSIITFLLPQITIIAARYKIDKTERFPPPRRGTLPPHSLPMTVITNHETKTNLETAIYEFFHVFGTREGINIDLKSKKYYFETGNVVHLQPVAGRSGSFDRVFDPPFNPSIPAKIQSALHWRISYDRYNGAHPQQYQLFVLLSRRESDDQLAFEYKWATMEQVPGARVIFGEYHPHDHTQVPEIYDRTRGGVMAGESSEESSVPHVHRTSTAGSSGFPSTPRLAGGSTTGSLPPRAPRLGWGSTTGSGVSLASGGSHSGTGGGSTARGEFNNYYYNYINDYEFDMNDISDLMYAVYLDGYTDGYKEGKRAKKLKQNRLLNRGYR